MNCFVRKAISKSTGKPYFCLVVKYNEGQKEKFFFGKAYDFLQLLGLSPQEFEVLDCGDYAIC